MPGKFNVRVYGILVREGQVLVSDEYIHGIEVTKFPGGGLEFGEGLIDCLGREFREELDLSITVEAHYYTTDFFVASVFDPGSQVISVYYLVKALSETGFATAASPHSYEKKEGAQAFRWLPLHTLSESEFTLVIDRKVAGMLAAEHRNGKL